MKLILFYIPFRWLPIVICSILFATLQAAAFRPVVAMPYEVLWIKSSVDALIMVGLGLLLTLAMASFHYVKLDFFQRLVNYFALGIIYIIVWSLLSYLFTLLIFGKEERERVEALIPLTAFVALLIYLIHLSVIHYRIWLRNDEPDNEPAEDDPVDPAALNQLSMYDSENDSGEEILERIAVKIGQKIHVILVPDIVYIQSDGDYVQIVTGQSRYLKEETMKYFEANLPRTQFVRVHRSYIVNVEKILRIELYEKQNQMLTLKNGDQIRASVSGYRELRTILNM